MVFSNPMEHKLSVCHIPCREIVNSLRELQHKNVFNLYKSASSDMKCLIADKGGLITIVGWNIG